MTRRARPLAVTRHIRAACWLPALSAVAIALLYVTEDVPAARPSVVDQPDEFLVRGTVVSDDGVPRVRYRHRVTKQDVTAEVFVWRRDLLPDVGGTVELVGQDDDPGSPTVRGDAMPLTTNAGLAVGWLAAACLPLVGRLGGHRGARRLAESAVVAFAMTGVVRPARRGSRCVLDLHPLDAVAGARPVCSVPLLTTAHAPNGVPIAVEVKGSPRAFGRVVARTATGELWPAGRALGRVGPARPAGAVVAPVGLAPVALPPDAARTPSVLSTVEARCALGALVLACAVAVMTMARSEHPRRVDTSGAPAVGKVVGPAPGGTEVVLQVDGRRVTAPADVPDMFDKGIEYPVRLDPRDPGAARLVTEPYDAVEPIVWSSLPLVVTCGLLVRQWLRGRAIRVASREGPAWAAFARAGPEGALLVCDRPGRPIGSIPLKGGAAVDGPVVVAGEAMPGQPVALWAVDGRAVPVDGWMSGAGRRA